MNTISKKKAKETGLKRYFTGKPCRRGHILERFVSSGACIKCTEVNARAWSRSHPEIVRAMRKSWAERNPERHRENRKALLARPHVKASQAKRSRKWHEENREKSNDNHYRWVERNPHMANAAQMRRRARKLERTCAWADHDAIKKVYAEAKRLSLETGIEYHVDHVVPLAGENVSGLHVETNLQILVGRVNQSKGNRLLEDLAA